MIRDIWIEWHPSGMLFLGDPGFPGYRPSARCARRRAQPRATGSDPSGIIYGNAQTPDEPPGSFTPPFLGIRAPHPGRDAQLLAPG